MTVFNEIMQEFSLAETLYSIPMDNLQQQLVGIENHFLYCAKA